MKRPTGSTGTQLGRRFRNLPLIRCNEGPAKVYQRKPPKVDGRSCGINIKLTWEQVCEMREWHEKLGFNARECLEVAQDMGWPVKNENHTRQLLNYIQRNKA